jgi:hypothetical protein
MEGRYNRIRITTVSYKDNTWTKLSQLSYISSNDENVCCMSSYRKLVICEFFEGNNLGRKGL